MQPPKVALGIKIRKQLARLVKKKKVRLPGAQALCKGQAVGRSCRVDGHACREEASVLGYYPAVCNLSAPSLAGPRVVAPGVLGLAACWLGPPGVSEHARASPACAGMSNCTRERYALAHPVDRSDGWRGGGWARQCNAAVALAGRACEGQWTPLYTR